MKIRYRLLLALCVTILLCGSALYYASYGGLLRSFQMLEAERSRLDVVSINEAFSRIRSEFHAKAAVWVNSDEARRLMAERSSLVRPMRPSLRELDASLMLTVDARQRTLLTETTSGKSRESGLDGPSVVNALKRYGALRRVPSEGVSGIFVSKGTPFFASIHALRGGGKGTTVLVLVRSIDRRLQEQLRTESQFNVSFLTAENAGSKSAFASALSEIGLAPITVTGAHGDKLSGLALVRDAKEDPAMMIKVDLNRSISAFGQSVVRSIVQQLVLLSVLFGLVVVFVVERFALSRLKALIDQVECLSDHLDDQRVDLPGSDELAYLAHRINYMRSHLRAVTDELRNSEARLKAHSCTLEIAVQERTKQLEHQSLHDRLTGLPNRVLFMDRVAMALQKARRSKKGTAVLFVDMDNFKLVNDSLGHAAGDELLKEFSKRLQSAVRPGDTVSRMGGDEFTILLENLDSVLAAMETAERVLAMLRTPVMLADLETFAGCSIGVAYAGAGATSAEDLVKDADSAMYRAKQSGKSAFVVYDESMHIHAIDRLELESSLRSALDREEIFVVYQPLVELRSGRIVGAEALARWNHETRGIVSPADFIPMAEQTGLIVPIGYWVLEEACRQALVWHEKTPGLDFTINVNVSGRQLQRGDVTDRVRQALERTGLAPHRLKLEITESILMEHKEDMVAKVRELKELGIKIAIDDFGTGYSSLGMLQSFPIDTVKIDRRFVEQLGEESSSVSIIEAILALTRALGMDATGEGIETPFQEMLLKQLGCRLGQGYLYDRPLAADELAERLGRSASYPSFGEERPVAA
ncbi:MAG: EAL domain-containing protein [Fimbriimonadaceae bacterium]|nr:EAL domain-containing protein [Fimbriimonadaceae bacterium]